VPDGEGRRVEYRTDQLSRKGVRYGKGEETNLRMTGDWGEELVLKRKTHLDLRRHRLEMFLARNVDSESLAEIY